MAALSTLSLSSNNVSDLSSLSGLSALAWLCLHSNNITDLAPLSNLTALSVITLSNNSVSDLRPLVANTGLGRNTWDEVWLDNNPIDCDAQADNIQALLDRGVFLYMGCP